jgi:hypothetical protein
MPVGVPGDGALGRVDLFLVDEVRLAVGRGARRRGGDGVERGHLLTLVM